MKTKNITAVDYNGLDEFEELLFNLVNTVKDFRLGIVTDLSVFSAACDLSDFVDELMISNMKGD